MGGVKPEIYTIYAKMFTLNQVVEKFLNQLMSDESEVAAV